MSANSQGLDWQVDGQRWPHRDASRFLDVGRLNWHYQVMGPENAPAMLLLHGTGAASHSWRNLMPFLALHFRIIAPDLPTHGFSSHRGDIDLSLDGITASLAEFLIRLAVQPQVIVGHSAGAAIAVALAVRSGMRGAECLPPHHVVGINGAFLPIRGNRLFSPMAKALFANPVSASVFSLLTRNTPLGDNLLAATGSNVDRAGQDVYRMLMGRPAQVRGALGMMAAWNLDRFDDLLGRLQSSLTLIAAKDDPMVPWRHSSHAVSKARRSQLRLAERGGHLLHECNAQLVSQWIIEAAHEPARRGADAA